MAGKVSRLRGCAWALTVATLPSCGGTAPPTAWSGDSGSAGRDAASEAGDVASDAAADDGPSDDSYEAIPPCGNPCPIAEPAVGDSCNFGAACEYGKSPFVPCNRVFSCISGRAAVVQNFISDASVCTTGLSARLSRIPRDRQAWRVLRNGGGSPMRLRGCRMRLHSRKRGPGGVGLLGKQRGRRGELSRPSRPAGYSMLLGQRILPAALEWRLRNLFGLRKPVGASSSLIDLPAARARDEGR